jgi:hypothetical protein
MKSMHASVIECGEEFTGKAIVAHVGNGALDPSFIPWMSHASCIHMKVARLRVLEKGRHDTWSERVRLDDDGFGVIRNQDAEDAAEELPGGFAGFDSAGRRFFENGIDKPIARENRGKNPSAKVPTPREQRESEPPDPAGVDL